jgi:xanthine dehydrogenase YagR molybdenum-binding subunit
MADPKATVSSSPRRPPDKEINELGARGIGEIGLAGIAAAITHATYHATGVRVRELPITIEKLI